MSTELTPTGKNIYGMNIILDAFNDRVMKHEVFGVSKRYTIPAGGSLYVVLDPTANGAFPKAELVFLPFSVSAFGAGPVEVDIHVSPTYTGGTVWGATDRSFKDPVVPHTVITAVTSLLTAGTVTNFEDQIEALAGQGSKIGIGGQVKEDLILEADPTMAYAIHLKNTDTVNAVRGVFSFNFIEE